MQYICNFFSLYNYKMKHKQKQAKNQKIPFGTADLLLNRKIVSPQKLKILVLSGNDLINQQLQFLSKCTNLIKLDLSYNHITKISAKLAINKIKNLKVLHLDSNKLMQVQSIEGLFQAPYIEMFSYKENLLQQNPKVEHLVINNFKNLKILNERVVFVEERNPSIILQRKVVFIQRYYQTWVPVQNSEAYYLKVLRLQLRYMDNFWMHNNPIVKIQRIWKSILKQKKNENQLKLIHYSKRTSLLKNRLQITKQLLPENKQLKNSFQIWKKYVQSIRQIKLALKAKRFSDQNGKNIWLNDRQYLTFEMSQCNIAKRNLKVQGYIKEYLKRVRAKLYIRKMARRFRANIKLKSLSFQQPESYFQISQMKTTRRIYFNRAQQHLVQNFLCHIAKNFKMNDLIYNKSTFGISNKYVSIRLMDPDTYSSKKCSNSFTYLLWPSMKAIILKRKKFPYKPRSSIIKVKPLSYIKNRDKKLTKEQHKKYVQTYKQIDRFFQNQYNESLGYFQCPSDFVLKQVIRMAFYHNMKALKFEKIIQRSQMLSLLQNYQQPLAIYTQKLLQRTTSAVRIQQQWRRYINNKRQKQSIYQKLLKKRAAMKIQRFLRDRIFYHRLSFQKHIALDLDLFKGSDLIFPQSCYMHLAKAVRQKDKYQLYKNLQVGFSKNQLKTNFQQFHRQVFFPTTRKRYFKDQSLKSNEDISNDIYRLLHHGSQIKKLQINGEIYYQFNFKNPQQTKIRIACFALLSYKMYGGKYLLPLSLNTINLYPDRMARFKQYGLINYQIPQYDQYKVISRDNITQNTCGHFIFIREAFQGYFPQQEVGKVQAQFYQKKYQNFPLKFENTMYWVNTSKKVEPLKQKLDKDMSREEHLHFLQNDQPLKKPTQYKNFVQGQIRQLQATISFHEQLNISKINQKRFSLNLLDYPPLVQNQLQKMKATQQIKSQIRRTEMQNKKQLISRFLNQQKEKRQYDKQKRKSDLGLLRDKRKQERIINMTLRNINQSQRTQQLRKKVNRIRQVKARSHSKKGNAQDDFIQQGNFIMEQQLKMVIMRGNIKQYQKIKSKKNSLVETKRHWSRTQKSQGSKSFYSNKSNQKKQKSALQLQNGSSVLKQASKQISGGHTQIINKRVYIKKKSSNTGAYIRDPAFVHGVFPQQYYPIQNKGALFLPKV